MFRYFTENDHPIDEYQTEIEDQNEESNKRFSTRNVVTKLHQEMVKHSKSIIKYIQSENKESEKHISKYMEIFGYPLEEMKSYQLKITNTDFYFPTGSFRPLVDNLSLQKYLTKNTFASASFELIEKEQSRMEKRVALQIGCLLGCNILPSWNFESLEVNQFREKVILPLKKATFPFQYRKVRIRKHINDLLPKSFLVRVHLSKDVAKSVYGGPNMNTADLISIVIKKSKSFIPNNVNESDYLLKLGEYDQIIFENLELGRILYVSDCLTRDKLIEFHLILKKSINNLSYIITDIQQDQNQLNSDQNQSDNENINNNNPENQNSNEENSNSNSNSNSYINHQIPCIISYDLLSDDLISTTQLSESEVSNPSSNSLFCPLFDTIPPHKKLSIYIDSMSGFQCNFPENTNLYGFIQIEIFHNGKAIADAVRTSPSSFNSLFWNENIEFDLSIKNIPLESRICFTLYSINPKNESKQALAWVACRLYDCNHCLRREKAIELAMYTGEGKANPIGSCLSNPNYGESPKLKIAFEYFKEKFIQLPRILPRRTPLVLPGDINEPSEFQIESLQKLIQSDPLYQPTKKEKRLLWHCREFYKNQWRGLPKFLLSVNWCSFYLVEEAYRLLDIWCPPENPVYVLELLGSEYEDERVRQYAVSYLAKISPYELNDYLLQLVQVLKHEKDHRSSLCLFLLNQATLYPDIIGQSLFWLLISEIEDPQLSTRFGLILEALLHSLSSQRESLLQQREFIQIIDVISHAVADEKTKQGKNETLHRLLKATRVPPSFQIPYDSSLHVSNLLLDHCKAMDSHQAPLLFAFNNLNLASQKVLFLFKSGDDLRQDVLTLQLIQIMDNLWCNDGLDLQMTPYRCITTGSQQGLIEIVKNSVTTADIHKKIGVRGAFSEACIGNWLEEHNPSLFFLFFLFFF